MNNMSVFPQHDASMQEAATVPYIVHAIDQRLQVAHATHMGYPYNLVGEPVVPPALSRYLINNLGDPYVGSHYGSDVCDLEREAIAWLMELWHCDQPEDFWGSIGASGTEGNLWGLYLAREAHPDGVLLYSADAHYSIPKAARLLRMESRQIASKQSGELDLAALKGTIVQLAGRKLILALTCGTTVKGAHDDIGGAIEVLDAADFGPGRRFIHVDGALNAMVLPFVAEAPYAIQPSFRHGIDSMSTSGHKMIGTPMPCGAIIARRIHVERVSSAIAYLRSNDTTLMGSRNGHAVIAIWMRLMNHNRDGYRTDVEGCLARAARMVAKLRLNGIPVLCNPYSLTVVFPRPSEAIVSTYQLACNGGDAHAVIMPNVSEQLIGRFTDDYLAWWASAALIN
jgi:histidine decarboxylase